jgi:hypothetical protein
MTGCKLMAAGMAAALASGCVSVAVPALPDRATAERRACQAFAEIAPGAICKITSAQLKHGVWELWFAPQPGQEADIGGDGGVRLRARDGHVVVWLVTQ